MALDCAIWSWIILTCASLPSNHMVPGGSPSTESSCSLSTFFTSSGLSCTCGGSAAMVAGRGAALGGGSASAGGAAAGGGAAARTGAAGAGAWTLGASSAEGKELMVCMLEGMAVTVGIEDSWGEPAGADGRHGSVGDLGAAGAAPLELDGSDARLEAFDGGIDARMSVPSRAGWRCFRRFSPMRSPCLRSRSSSSSVFFSRAAILSASDRMCSRSGSEVSESVLSSRPPRFPGLPCKSLFQSGDGVF
mmetsp:Transcript_2010/g.4580  ORF Transcript_2010/g.4580 Transcript_2010/m.4580 type:complete len:248 (+) Transcript_2010:1565-2308(+)